MTNNTFYITTTTPYVNAEPHIGFALEIITADAIARYHALLGEEVRFNTGTDEHGQKIYQKAQEEGMDPQAYTDKNAETFRALKKLLNLSYTNFIRTTELHHKQAAQEFWQRCAANVDEQGRSDIYKQLYEVKYCIGCELEKTDSELEEGKCPLHPTRELEIRKEENYFFRFSRYQQALLDLYDQQPNFVRPAAKLKEIRSFVEGGLRDFSISRLKEKMPWGVSVPGDDDHVMYVWFDALINYISTLGWPEKTDEFDRFWPGMQIAGKDNLRQQSAMWQAMLLSAGLPTSAGILINGFISIGGQKMSKSLGNVIIPQEMVDRYGVDGARYLIINLGPIGTDMDVTWEKLDAVYTADLANGLGNLCSRVAKLCEKANFSYTNNQSATEFKAGFTSRMTNFELAESLNWVSSHITDEDKYLDENKPWKKETAEQNVDLQHSVETIISIAFHLQPFMPQAAQKILDHFGKPKITALKPLFPRLDQA